jgi:uncharacterized MAPEG superfamily protein
MPKVMHAFYCTPISITEAGANFNTKTILYSTSPIQYPVLAADWNFREEYIFFVCIVFHSSQKSDIS